MKTKSQIPIILLITLIVFSVGCTSTPNEDNNQTPTNGNQTNETEFKPPTNISLKEEQEFIQSNNEFTLNLYKKLTNNNENAFLSPWSVSTALKMTYEGAQEQTEEEIRTTLNLPKNKSKTRTHYYLTQKEMNQVKDYELIEANAFWYQKGYPFTENYTSKIKNYYNGKTSELNIADEPEKSRKTINNWVANKTKEKIPELLKTLNPGTKSVLTNAIYFKGMWKYPFNKTNTKNETFHLNENKTIQTPIMNGEQEIYYAENQEYKAVKLPYETKNPEEKASMLIILPKQNQNTTQKLNQLKLEEINQLKNNLTKSQVEIKLPKFKFKTTYDQKLKQALIDLGIKKAFTVEANFNGMTKGSNELFISQVIHNAYVNVNENGTEAAAATAITLVESTPTQKNKFHANHPFTFIIQKNNNILFIGKLTNPKTK